jgi:hypothetical protein
MSLLLIGPRNGVRGLSRAFHTLCTFTCMEVLDGTTSRMAKVTFTDDTQGMRSHHTSILGLSLHDVAGRFSKRFLMVLLLACICDLLITSGRPLRITGGIYQEASHSHIAAKN